MTEEQTRVARGAAMLDEAKPEWYRLINPNKLNVFSSTECPLPIAFGFLVTGRISHMTLKDAWRHEVNERLMDELDRWLAPEAEQAEEPEPALV